MKKPRVLMADDHSLILAGLRKLVEGQCDVVGMVEDGRALVEAAQKLRPDLILLDISMPLLRVRATQPAGSFRSRPAIKRILQTFS